MFKIVTFPHQTGDFGTFEKYPDACKASDALSKETKKFYAVIDLNEVESPKVEAVPMWTDKDLPKPEFDERMYGTSAMTNTSDSNNEGEPA